MKENVCKSDIEKLVHPSCEQWKFKILTFKNYIFQAFVSTVAFLINCIKELVTFFLYKRRQGQGTEKQSQREKFYLFSSKMLKNIPITWGFLKVLKVKNSLAVGLRCSVCVS